MSLENIKTISEIIAHIAEALAIAAGGWWFLYTTQSKPRVQFDVGARVFSPPPNSTSQIVELSLIFDNKGYVEYRLWNLNVSVHGLVDTKELTAKSETNEIMFDK